MCAEEQLKLRCPLYQEDLRSMALAQEPSTELHEDLITLYDGDDLTADEVVESEIINMQDSTSAEIVNWLRQRGRIRRVTMYTLPSDYEDVFTLLARRTDRPLPRSIPERLSRDMRQFFKDSFVRRKAIRDGAELLPLPDLKQFKPLFAYLPERLDFSSWVGDCLLSPLYEEIKQLAGESYKVGWINEVLDIEEGIRVEQSSGMTWYTSEYTAVTSEPGRLTCFQKQNGAPQVELVEQTTAECRAIICMAEEILIKLSYLIADTTTIRIIEDYAIPGWEREQRPLLDRKEIGRAVREILGDKFFDLPFDLPTLSLKQWSADYIVGCYDEIDARDPYRPGRGGSR